MCTGREGLASLYEKLEDNLTDAFLFLPLSLSTSLELHSYNRNSLKFAFYVYNIVKYPGKSMCQPLRLSTTDNCCVLMSMALILPSPMTFHPMPMSDLGELSQE